ncbi:DUF4384 domain-containing protein [bacterium]|nr:MAG: DUF4384 domain-containing protein [bacterium]
MTNKLLILFAILLFSNNIITCDNFTVLEPIVKDLGNNWFEVKTCAIIENITPDQAKDIAISKAYDAAIEFFSGVNVSSRNIYIQAEEKGEIKIDHFSKLIKQTSLGIILEKELLDESIEIFGENIYKIVTMKIRVGKQTGESDFNFNLHAVLNKEYFKEGESLKISVTPSIDCYIIILNIMSDENVITIFPNEFRKENFVKANQEFILPNEEDRINGISFELGLLPDREEDTEFIKIIASKKPINLSINTNYKSAFESLQNWLVTIPLDEIAEVDLQYYIYK